MSAVLAIYGVGAVFAESIIPTPEIRTQKINVEVDYPTVCTVGEACHVQTSYLSAIETGQPTKETVTTFTVLGRGSKKVEVTCLAPTPPEMKGKNSATCTERDDFGHGYYTFPSEGFYNAMVIVREGSNIYETTFEIYATH